MVGEDPMECEVEIVAKPRGKHLQSISLMSSGERALTAIALLFAIYLVKPSPFCLLDEVDAPLDDANVERFLNMLRRFGEPHAVRGHHAQQEDHGSGRLHLRRHHAGAGHLEARLREPRRRGREPRLAPRSRRAVAELSGPPVRAAREPSRLARAGLPRMNLWNKFRDGLQRTRDAIVGGVGAALGRSGPVDAATLEALEEALLAADVGPDTTDRLIERARRLMGQDRALDLRGALERAAEEMLRGRARAGAVRARDPAQRPWVVLVVGVNGAGKTTFAGKLAARFTREGHPALLVAADTFRAAASEQLVVWAERAGVEIVRARDGADPAAVVHDGLGRGEGARHARRARGHRGPAAHAAEPDGRAGEDRARLRAAGARGAAPRAARARRHAGAERPRPGARVRQGRCRSRASR